MSLTTTAAESRRIAENIKNQIDPGVLMRIGAREFASDGTALRFRVGPGRGSKKVVKITLTAADLYIVQCFEARGRLSSGTFRIETTFEEGTGDHGGLYHDMLDDSLLRLEREVLGS